MKNKPKAFSLIELSIVILIIGILIAGVTQGSRLMTSFKVQTAQTLTQSSPVSTIKGLSLWLEPTMKDSFLETETENDTQITTWKDINPQILARNVFTTTATQDIIYQKDGINNLPSILFSGETSYDPGPIGPCLTGQVINSVNNAYTIFAISNLSANALEGYLFSIGDDTNLSFGRRSNSGSMYRNASFGSSGEALGTIVSVSEKDSIFTLTVSASSVDGALATQKAQTWLNGQTDSPLFSLTQTLGTTVNTARVGNSGSGDSNIPWNGLISEIIIFDHELKTADRKEIENYLSQKYNIALTQ